MSYHFNAQLLILIDTYNGCCNNAPEWAPALERSLRLQLDAPFFISVGSFSGQIVTPKWSRDVGRKRGSFTAHAHTPSFATFRHWMTLIWPSFFARTPSLSPESCLDGPRVQSSSGTKIQRRAVPIPPAVSNVGERSGAVNTCWNCWARFAFVFLVFPGVSTLLA